MSHRSLFLKNINTGAEKEVPSRKALAKFLRIPETVIQKWDGVALLKGVWRVQNSKDKSLETHKQFLLDKGTHYVCKRCATMLSKTLVSKCPLCGQPNKYY